MVSVALSAILGAVAVLAGHRVASSAVIDLGPTDAHYVSGFREIERDGPAYFRWTTVPSSSLAIPLRFCGPGSIRMRARRHFVEPAVLSVFVAGTQIGQASIQAGSDEPYSIIEFPVAKTICTTGLSVLLESSVENDRPLGAAVDWVEIRADSGFLPAPQSMWRGAALVSVLAVALLLSGARNWLVLSASGLASLGLALAFAMGPVAAERMLRGGVVASLLTLGLGLLISRFSLVALLPQRAGVLLVAVTAITLLSRLAFLHPQAFYPDYRVHGLVQQTLTSLGLGRFMDQLFEIQYARSLGLQEIGGNWYPFPYPPGAYVLATGVGTISGLDALDAATVTAAIAAALIPLLTVSIGLSLGLGFVPAVGGAVFVALMPLLIRRMALGYFPGVIGQCLDALALLLAIRLLRAARASVRDSAAVLVALLLGFLVYTQSIANFGLFIATLLLAELLRRTASARATLYLALAAAMALGGAVGAFYWRYVPVMENVASGQPQPESRVLDRLDQLRRQALANQDAVETEDLNDPYAGTTVSPFRGAQRLASRVWRFHGPFSFAILLGLGMLWRRSERPTRNLLLAWGSVCVWISVLAAGLPSPNTFQHLKDLEFVAPLFALAMGALSVEIWARSRVAAVALGGTWAIYALSSFAAEWSARLLPLAGL